jgi:hypothetical protein
MKRIETSARLIPLGRVSRETRSFGGNLPEASNPILLYKPV